MTYIHHSIVRGLILKKLNFVSDKIIALSISTAPMPILSVNTSLKIATENAMPQKASVDRMIAAFVSEIYF